MSCCTWTSWQAFSQTQQTNTNDMATRHLRWCRNVLVAQCWEQAKQHAWHPNPATKQLRFWRNDRGEEPYCRQKQLKLDVKWFKPRCYNNNYNSNKVYHPRKATVSVFPDTKCKSKAKVFVLPDPSKSDKEDQAPRLKCAILCNCRQECTHIWWKDELFQTILYYHITAISFRLKSSVQTKAGLHNTLVVDIHDKVALSLQSENWPDWAGSVSGMLCCSAAARNSLSLVMATWAFTNWLISWGSWNSGIRRICSHCKYQIRLFRLRVIQVGVFRLGSALLMQT